MVKKTLMVFSLISFAYYIALTLNGINFFSAFPFVIIACFAVRIMLIPLDKVSKLQDSTSKETPE